MAGKRKGHGIPGMGNTAMYSAMVGQYTSNAGGSHDSRPKRERSRAAAKRAEIRRNAD